MFSGFVHGRMEKLKSKKTSQRVKWVFCKKK
jgi:hypothetical protein